MILTVRPPEQTERKLPVRSSAPVFRHRRASRHRPHAIRSHACRPRFRAGPKLPAGRGIPHRPGHRQPRCWPPAALFRCQPHQDRSPVDHGVTGSPEARLTVEQQVTPDILFTYITDVSSTSTQLIRVEWAFNRNWSAILIREENGYVGMDFASRSGSNDMDRVSRGHGERSIGS